MIKASMAPTQAGGREVRYCGQKAFVCMFGGKWYLVYDNGSVINCPSKFLVPAP